MLLGTRRAGMDKLIDWMENNGFFTSPCSGGNHLAKEGGLAEHSLNVFRLMNADAACKMKVEDYESNKSSIIITSLLHDLGKCGDYGKPGYVPNMIKDSILMLIERVFRGKAGGISTTKRSFR